MSDVPGWQAIAAKLASVYGEQRRSPDAIRGNPHLASWIPLRFIQATSLDLPSDAYSLIRSVAHHLQLSAPPPIVFGSDELRKLEEEIQKVVETTH